jgi:hypothetical protein
MKYRSDFEVSVASGEQEVRFVKLVVKGLE